MLAGLLAVGPAYASPNTARATTASTAATASTGATATAQALPTTLTKNKIYRSGTVDALDCPTSATRDGSAASVKTFLLQVGRCVNRMWTAQFKAVGQTFRAPKIIIKTTGTRSPCGTFTRTSPAHYCPGLQTIYFRLLKSQIKQPFELVLAKTMAHEYGHHVQRRSGMWNAYYGIASYTRGTTARNLLSHRLEQQAECFAGVFLNATQDSLPVDSEEYDYINTWASKNATDKVHGKGRNQVYWLQRGFDTGSPNACNTWIAASARVA
jgi:predicted metalloprotease